MAHRSARTFALVAAAVLIGTAIGGATDVKALTRDLFAVPSTTGNEDRLAAKLRERLPKGLAVETDGLGTVAVRLPGAAGPTLVLAALDGYGHMVSGITPDGTLTVDRPVAPPHARFDAYLLGQPVVISTVRGPVAGVVSQPALHLLTQERRRTLVEGFSLETAFIDIGVRSEKEARAKGVALLDPVTYPTVLTELAGDQWAGPSLGQKAVAAVLVVVAEALQEGRAADETIIAWAAQTKFTARGRGARPPLGAVRAKTRWQPKRVVVVDVVAADLGAARPDGPPVVGRGPVILQASGEGPGALPEAVAKAAAGAGLPAQRRAGTVSALTIPFNDLADQTLAVALPVGFLGTPSEIVSLQDLQALGDLLARFLRAGGGR
jgi:putative aminopeptidase FrvX